MELWKKKLIDFMRENNLTRSETIDLINENGGQISKSGFTHWLNENIPDEDGFRSRTSKPSLKNGLALEKMIGKDFDFKSIYNGSVCDKQ